MKFEALPKFISRVVKILSFLTFLSEPSKGFTATPQVATKSASSKQSSTALPFQNEPKEIPVEKMTAIARMRSADKPLKKLPDNAHGILEETLRILYSHRITHQIRFKRAQKPIHNGMSEWAVHKIHQEARRRSDQLDDEIVLVTQCMAALQQQKATTSLAPSMLHKIQLLLDVDFKDPNHVVPVAALVEDVSVTAATSVKATKASSTITAPTTTTVRPRQTIRNPFPTTRNQRLPAFALA